MKVFAYIIAFASLTALLAGPPGPHGWSQPRIETKAPEPKWIELKSSTTNVYYGEWFVDNSEEGLRKRYPELFAPKIQVVRTYAKTNVDYKMIQNPNPVYENGLKLSFDWIPGPATTNLVTVHVLGYFSGTNAVELLEIEKPQTK